MTAETGAPWVADAFALEDLVQGKSWAYGHGETGDIWGERLTFESGGKLLGYEHPNEAGWRISDGALELLNDQGEVSNRFARQTLVDGQIAFEGRFQLCEAGGLHRLIARDDVPRPRHRTAVIIPIHEPYFKYGVNFLYQAMGGDFDPVLVFSTELDRRNFAEMHQASPAIRYRAIVASDHFSASAIDTLNAKRNWITSKKFLALQLLQKHYDYFYCVDAETFILSPQGWLDGARDALMSRVWHAGASPTDGEKAIMRHSALALAPPEDFDRLAQVTQDWGIYSWWWDLPVYDAAHLPGFFAWMDWSPTRASVARYGFDAFDHLTYQLYTVLHAGFRFLHVHGVSHSMEFARAPLVQGVHQSIAPMRWVNAYAYAQDPAFFREKGYLAVYHMDRKTFPQFAV